MQVVYRPAALANGQRIRIGNRLVQPIRRPFEGGGDIIAGAEPRCEGRGEGAASAVGILGLHSGRFHAVHLAIAGDHGVIGNRRVKVPALDDDRRIRLSGPRRSHLDGTVQIRGFLRLRQHRQLLEVGRDDISAGAQLAHRLFCLGVQKTVSAGSHHDRV